MFPNFSDPRERDVGVFARGDHTGFMTQTSSETLCFKLIDKNLHWEERGADVSQCESVETFKQGTKLDIISFTA